MKASRRACSARCRISAYRHGRSLRERAGGRPGARCVRRARGEVFVTPKSGIPNCVRLTSAARQKRAFARLGTRSRRPAARALAQSDVPLDETIGALCDAQRRGLTRFIGRIEFSVALLDRAWRCRHRRWSRTSANTIRISTRPSCTACFAHGMALISHSPLGSASCWPTRLSRRLLGQHHKSPRRSSCAG